MAANIVRWIFQEGTTTDETGNPFEWSGPRTEILNFLLVVFDHPSIGFYPLPGELMMTSLLEDTDLPHEMMRAAILALRGSLVQRMTTRKDFTKSEIEDINLDLSLLGGIPALAGIVAHPSTPTLPLVEAAGSSDSQGLDFYKEAAETYSELRKNCGSAYRQDIPDFMWRTLARTGYDKVLREKRALLINLQGLYNTIESFEKNIIQCCAQLIDPFFPVNAKQSAWIDIEGCIKSIEKGIKWDVNKNLTSIAGKDRDLIELQTHHLAVPFYDTRWLERCQAFYYTPDDPGRDARIVAARNTPYFLSWKKKEGDNGEGNEGNKGEYEEGDKGEREDSPRREQ
ncbi:hypothetical protein F4808DRAFT_465099 [Astrocystis sublimbata]|nr:hypothetical protein F4808DRAFT_465099 [Astrocystis sublimbata]